MKVVSKKTTTYPGNKFKNKASMSKLISWLLARYTISAATELQQYIF